MNLSISSLRLRSLSNSPLFTATLNRNLFIQKSQFTKFASNLFIKTTPHFIESTFYETKFTNFMSSVIKVSTENHVGLKYTTTYTPEVDSSVSFQKCNFQNCENTECGGAILVDDYAFVLNISACVFSGCISQKNGGAIYSDCKSSKIKRTHFLRCHTGSGCSYQAFYISIKGNFDGDSIQISKNGDSVEDDSFSTFNIRRGISNSKQFNVTKNIVYNFGTCLSTTLSRTSQFQLSYSNFIHNKCKDRELFAFFHCSDVCELSRINVVENSGGSTSLLFNAVSNSHVTVHHSVIIRNHVAGLALVSDINLILFEKCVSDIEQTQSRTVHNIDCTFKKGEYNTIQIMKP